MSNERKPLGHKCYGHIPHLPGSRRGPGDHKCHEGQMKIACEKLRNRHDRVIVTEKLDGSNVGVAMINNEIVALTRAGYLAETSPFAMHHYFMGWVVANKNRFSLVLRNGERLCGEWLLVAHGTKYDLPHEPFIAFDIMAGQKRMPCDDFKFRVGLGDFTTPHVISDGGPTSIDDAMCKLGKYGFHGALEPVEGAVWRVERSVLIDKTVGNSGGRWAEVDFLVKYVRPDKEDGKYLNGGDVILNNYEQGVNE